MNNDLYIELLKYCFEHPNDNGIPVEDIIEALKEYAGEGKIRHIIQKATPSDGTGLLIAAASHYTAVTKVHLSLEGRMRYAEYEELALARQNAQDAKRFSMASIFIALLALIVSGALGLWQIYSPVNIHEDQFNKLLNVVESAKQSNSN